MLKANKIGFEKVYINPIRFEVDQVEKKVILTQPEFKI